MSAPGRKTQVVWTVGLALVLAGIVTGYLFAGRPLAGLLMGLSPRMSTIDARMSALASEQRVQAKNMDELAAACTAMSANALQTAQGLAELARTMAENSYPKPLRNLYFNKAKEQAKEKKP